MYYGVDAHTVVQCSVKPAEKHSLVNEYNYYEDIAVLAFPNDSIVPRLAVVDQSGYFDGTFLTGVEWMGSPNKEMVVMRIVHTTNGKTNAAQSPVSGQGLECDKMRREAVKHFWDGYPRMLIDIAGDMAGTVFTMIEIDSYEASGQNWSGAQPEEFKKRKGYDLTAYLPLMAERVLIESKEESGRFMKDLSDVATSLFAENYYGYLNELVSQTPSLTLQIEPYGTGRQQPFQVIDTRKILNECPTAIMATEFWVKPDTWGWKDMTRHERSHANLGET